MDDRIRKRTSDEDVPIIGDYSEAANARLRPEPPMAPPEPVRTAARPAAEQWHVDPRDVRRHAKLKRQREGSGLFGKIARYGLLVAALVAAFFVYRNFETLRTIEIDFSDITNLFADVSGTVTGGPRSGGEIKTDEFQAPAVAGVNAPTSVGDTPPPVQSVAEPAAARAEPQTAEPSETAQITPPQTVATVEPSPDAGLAASAPPAPVAAPEPPPGPENFEFGLSTVSVSEAEASAPVIVLRNGDRRRASSITWWTEDGTAKAGLDYVNLGKVSERFSAGEQNRTIHIPLVGDHKVEGPETFYVYLAASEDADPTIELTQKVEVVINDD